MAPLIVPFMLGLMLAAPLVTPPASSPKAPPPWDLVWTIDPPDGSPTKPRPRPSAKLRELGRSLYLDRCAVCHGDKGDADSALARQLRPTPTAFFRGVYKLRSTPAGSLPTDGDLFRTLTRGLHGTAMKPWRRLSERERWALVGHLKSLSPRFASEPPAAAVAVPTPPRQIADIQERGEALYLRYACGACHGTTGEGDGPAHDRWRGTGRRETRARDFSRGRFIRGAEMEDLYLTLKVGIEGTPMMAYALPDEELWALAAYVRVLVRERPLEDFPPAGTQASDEHAPGAGLPDRPGN